jgi:hypothetical protein
MYVDKRKKIQKVKTAGNMIVNIFTANLFEMHLQIYQHNNMILKQMFW